MLQRGMSYSQCGSLSHEREGATEHILTHTLRAAVSGLLWLQWPSDGGELGLHPKPRVQGIPTLTRTVSLRPLMEWVGHWRWARQVGRSVLSRFSQETNAAFQVGPGSHEVKRHLLSGY